LLTEFAALARSGPPERTLLQIAGYPQLEEVASNILAFYLEPSSGHGLGTLLLDTLLTFLPETGAVSAQSVRVEREVVTTGGKRIDIVVTTDTLVLGIENKINHAVFNHLMSTSHICNSSVRDGRCMECSCRTVLLHHPPTMQASCL
jgi:hypothetical protein